MCMIFVNEDSNPDLCDAGAVLDQLSYLDPVDVSISIIHGLSIDLLNDQGPVSKKSGNYSGLFRVTQFPSYLRNAEVLRLQTSQSSWFFLH